MSPLLAMTSLFLALQVGPQNATIEGVVVTQSDGSPGPTAGVELARVVPAGGNAGTLMVAATTAEGRFVLTNVPRGVYRLAATHIGYVRSS